MIRQQRERRPPIVARKHCARPTRLRPTNTRPLIQPLILVQHDRDGRVQLERIVRARPLRRLGRHQQVGDVDLTRSDRHVVRRLAVLIALQWAAGIARKQVRDDRPRAATGRTMQRREAQRTLRVRIDAALDKIAHDRHMPARRSVVQRRPAVRILRLGRLEPRMLHQRLDDGRMPAIRRDMDRRLAGRVVDDERAARVEQVRDDREAAARRGDVQGRQACRRMRRIDEPKGVVARDKLAQPLQVARRTGRADVLHDLRPGRALAEPRGLPRRAGIRRPPMQRAPARRRGGCRR